MLNSWIVRLSAPCLPENSSTETMWWIVSAPHGRPQNFPRRIICDVKPIWENTQRVVLWMFAKMWGSPQAPSIAAPGHKKSEEMMRTWWGNVKSTPCFPFYIFYTLLVFLQAVFEVRKIICRLCMIDVTNMPKTWWTPQRPMVNTHMFIIFLENAKMDQHGFRPVKVLVASNPHL